MSTEPEDLLEEALRGDLPGADAEARVRRRLLAAGVAVGNGVATTTAAAAGAGATATKLAGLSWGLKLGLAAAIAIPSVGLLLDSRTGHSNGGAAPPTVAGRAGNAPMPVQSAKPALAVAPAEPPNISPIAQAPERPQTRVPKATEAEAAAAGAIALAPPHPSQASFAAAAEPPPRAAQVGSSLAEETRLLDSAFAALTAGNLTRAAALIHEHEARFPRGLLQQERERAKARLSELSRGE